MCVIEEIATIETETIDLKGCRVWEMTCQRDQSSVFGRNSQGTLKVIYLCAFRKL